jgi:hypothetical protein
MKTRQNINFPEVLSKIYILNILFFSLKNPPKRSETLDDDKNGKKKNIFQNFILR